MPKSGLHGPHPLTRASINAVVSAGGIGVYILGHTADGSFKVKRSGRSDTCLASRLHDHVGDYNEFKYGFLNSEKEAFEYECRLHHDFSPSDNEYHPDRPDGTAYTCPHCKIFD